MREIRAMAEDENICDYIQREIREANKKNESETETNLDE
jgi:hypothetical protein